MSILCANRQDPEGGERKARAQADIPNFASDCGLPFSRLSSISAYEVS